MVVNTGLHLIHHFVEGKGFKALRVFRIGIAELLLAGWQLVVDGIRDRFQPFVGGTFFHLGHIGQVLKP